MSNDVLDSAKSWRQMRPGFTNDNSRFRNPERNAMDGSHIAPITQQVESKVVEWNVLSMKG